MRKTNKILFCFLALGVLFSGCTAIYKAGMDERSLSTQAEDGQIAMAIRNEFLNDDNMKIMDISTYCFKGNVYLVGEYETLSQKNQAVKLARGVEGVKSVTDHFLAKKKDNPCGTTDNIELMANVRGKLIGDTDIGSTDIEVKTVQCTVVLLGLVSSRDQINKAIAHAKSVEGVRKVTSYLKVVK
jgi:hyperosmotically inducible protein